MQGEVIGQILESRYIRMGGAVAAVALAAACSSAPRANSNGASPEFSEATSSSSEPSPSASSTLAPSLEDCDSIRAVQPGEYLSQSYAEHINEQLELIKVAYSEGSNVDIDHDLIFRYLPMLHAMENDPLYATAMKRASVIIKRNPDVKLTAGTLLSWEIPRPELCAPERISDVDSGKQLAQTGDVGLEVGKALLGHLADQGTRGAHMLKTYLLGAMEWFDRHLDSEVGRLQNPQVSSE